MPAIHPWVEELNDMPDVGEDDIVACPACNDHQPAEDSFIGHYLDRTRHSCRSCGHYFYTWQDEHPAWME